MIEYHALIFIKLGKMMEKENKDILNPESIHQKHKIIVVMDILLVMMHLSNYLWIFLSSRLLPIMID
jgi:hypothetical protein